MPRWIATGIFFLLAGAGPLFAGSFEVAPTTIYLSRQSPSGVFYITNRGINPIVAQIEAFDWQQREQKDHLDPTPALKLSPPLVHLVPGQRQTVRFAVSPNESITGERAFRLVVSELPDPAQASEEGIQVLLQFSLPVFVGGAGKNPARLEWSLGHGEEGNLLVTAHNSGGRHSKLSDLSVTMADGEEMHLAPDAFSYILAQMSYAWQVPMPEWAAGKMVHIKARDESDGAINASLFIPQ